MSLFLQRGLDELAHVNIMDNVIILQRGLETVEIQELFINYI